jgi:rare lipoprotein A
MKLRLKISHAILLVTSFLYYSFVAPTSSYQEQEPTKDTLKTVVEPINPRETITEVGTLKLVLLHKNGHASYYADKFTGRKTASGKIFNNNAYTCASKTLPFGTRLKVTSPATKKSVIVVVTDRGPYVKGRDIDLSKRAFMDIAPRSYGGSLSVIIEKIVR